MEYLFILLFFSLCVHSVVVEFIYTTPFRHSVKKLIPDGRDFPTSTTKKSSFLLNLRTYRNIGTDISLYLFVLLRNATSRVHTDTQWGLCRAQHNTNIMPGIDTQWQHCVAVTTKDMRLSVLGAQDVVHWLASPRRHLSAFDTRIE
jgi:hypothetical protein